MAVQKRTRRNVAYGFDNALQALAPQPIIAQRNPTTSDSAPLGTLWTNEATGAYFILTSVSGGASNWAAQSTSSSTVASLEITGGSGTVLTLDGTGGALIGGDLAVSGDTVITGDLTVTGDLAANGAFSLTSASQIDFTSTDNAPDAIIFQTNGGSSETMTFQVVQGTGVDSLSLSSTLGGILIEAVNNTSNSAVHVLADLGGYQLDAIKSSQVNVTGAGQDLLLNATGGSIAITATESTAGAINISASGVAGTLILQGVGGATLETTNAAMSIVSGTGDLGVATDAAAQNVNIATGAAQKTLVVGSVNGASATTVQSGSGALNVTATGGVLNINSGVGALTVSGDASATVVHLGTGAAVKTCVLGSTSSTSATTVQSGTGALNITAVNGAMTLKSGTGILSVANDATIQTVNLATGAAAKTINLGSSTSGTNINISADPTIPVTFNGGISFDGGTYLLSGAGTPQASVTAPQGSLYLNTTGNSTSTRAYINVDGADNWAAITTAS